MKLEPNIEQIESEQYSMEVIYAVRYGYQYRIAAEEASKDDSGRHYRLADASPIILEIAKLVLSGVSYDLIKKYAQKFWNKMMRMKIEIPDDVNKMLIDEDELWRFVTYVDEFNSKRLSSNEKEIKYIRDEIIADYVGEKGSEIFQREGRLPNHEEWVAISKEATELADELLFQRNKDS